MRRGSAETLPWEARAGGTETLEGTTGKYYVADFARAGVTVGTGKLKALKKIKRERSSVA